MDAFVLARRRGLHRFVLPAATGTLSYMAINADRPSRSGAKPTNGAAPAAGKVTRGQAAANALASVRAEGLDPSIAEPLLERWAREEITDAQLDEGARRIAAGESLTDLLGPAHA